MCGIIGIISDKPVAAPIFDGLKRLEYRGYDSAGIATLIDGQLQRRRAEGKLEALARELEAAAAFITFSLAFRLCENKCAMTSVSVSEVNSAPPATNFCFRSR